LNSFFGSQYFKTIYIKVFLDPQITSENFLGIATKALPAAHTLTASAGTRTIVFGARVPNVGEEVSIQRQ